MEYVDTELKPVEDSVKKQFNKLESHLNDLYNQGKVQLLYRGEELGNLKKRLLRRKITHESSEIYERAFQFGEKARHFSVDFFTPGRKYLTGIDDQSDPTFKFIHERICNVLNEPKLSQRVAKYIDDRFRQFFLKPGSRVDFLKKINDCYTDKLKTDVRDYYLYFLHVAGSAGIRRETMLVSTSKDKSIAVQFSKSKERVVYHYFIPEPFQHYAIGPWEIEHHEKIIYAIELPSYSPKGLFPEQSEIAVKGALFPNFILGMELVEENKFIINPQFIDKSNMDNVQSIAKQGFYIDQSNFDEMINNTGYLRYGVTYGNGTFESHDVKR